MLNSLSVYDIVLSHFCLHTIAILCYRLRHVNDEPNTKTYIMKPLIFLTLFFISVNAGAQISKVSLQASGLTCSMCSNSIHKSLKTLAFVLRVEADIKTYTFEIYFKPNSEVDFGQIRKKVESAGFAVSGFVATTSVKNLWLKKNQPLIIDANTLLIDNAAGQLLNGEIKIKLVDKGFTASGKNKSTPATTIAPAEAGTYHAILNNKP